MRISDWSSDVCSSDLAGAPDSDPAEPDGVDVLFADVLPVEVSFGLLPLMSATCFAPWFTDAKSSPFFRCCVLCDPWFSVCHSCRSQACNAHLIFQIACDTFARSVCSFDIVRAHVCTPVNNAHLVCSLLTAKQKHITN